MSKLARPINWIWDVPMEGNKEEGKGDPIKGCSIVVMGLAGSSDS